MKFKPLAVLAILANTASAGDLCAYWPLDETSGTVVLNTGGSADANLYNGASWGAGTINNALSFNGVNQYAKAYVNVPETNTAVSLWFRTTQPGGGLYSVTEDGGGNDRHIYLDGGIIKARIWSEEIISSSVQNYADGQWHQIVHTFGGVAGGQKLYVDGVLVGGGSKSASDFSWQTAIHLGYSVTSPTHFFNGQLDDVRIWNRALTAAEALALAQRSGTASNPNPPANGIIGGATLKLDWLAPTGATSHDIYLGNNPDLDNSTPASADFMGNFTVRPLDVADATPGQYYWRVDERLDDTVFKGPLWSFLYLGENGTSALNLTQPTCWWVAENDTFTQSGAVTGTGPLCKDGPGSLTLSGTGINYSGDTLLNGGSLTIAGTPNFNSAIHINAGQLNFDTFNNYNVLPKPITGTGPVEIFGNNTNWTHFTAENTYTGGTIIHPGGLLLLGMNTASGSVLGDITANGTLGLYHSNAWTFSNNLSGTGALNLYSPGGNPVTVSGNTISLANLNAFQNPGGILTNTTLNLSGSLNLSTNSTLTIGSGANITVAGGMTQGGNAYYGTMSTLRITDGNLTFGDQINDGWDGAYSILQTGGTLTATGITGGNGGGNWTTDTYNLEGGTLILGANGINGPSYKWPWFPYGGGLTLNLNFGGGTLSASANWSTPWSVNLTGTNGALTINPAGYTITLNGPLTGSGGVNLTGNGKLILNAANNHSATTIAAGTTLGGTTLGGTGSVTGPVTNHGTIAPGTVAEVSNLHPPPSTNSTPGTFTINNTLTLAPDSAIEFQIADWTGTPGTGHDSLAVNTLDLTATPEQPVTIHIHGQSPANFSEIEKTFTLIQSTEAIPTPIDPAQIIIDASNFSGQGTWTVHATGNQIVLAYYPPQDSDQDGLTYAEEIEFGSNPNSSDADADGLSDAQEKFFGTNPNAADNRGMVNETIQNGDFSLHPIGKGKYGERAVIEGWDYWEGSPKTEQSRGTEAIPGWTAIAGGNIELQTIWPMPPANPNAPANPYCELKAHPAEHYGITQQVPTEKGKTYILALDCRTREVVDPAQSNFDIKIEGTTEPAGTTEPGGTTKPAGTTVKHVTFTNHSGWTTQAVAFTADIPGIVITLIPTSDAGNRKGCLVDNVRLLPVEVEAVFERDQVANRISNPKRPNYYAITSSGNSEDSKSKYYNRLFVSTEPETGDVEITVKHPVFPHSIAQLLTVDITDDTGQVIASAQLDESGETKIEFLPLESTPTKVFYVDISYQSDAGQNPELLLKSYTKNNGSSIQIVTPENIQNQKNSLAIVIGPFANTIAGSFYQTFLGNGSGPTDSVSLAPKVRAIHEEPPTMIAGSIYEQSSWTTEIPSFQLADGSGASNIAETYFSNKAGFGLHEICRNLMDQNHGQIWNEMTTGGIATKNYTFSIPSNTGVSFYYPGVNPPKYIWGGATYKSGSVTLKLKKTGNKIETTGIEMQGVIEDYYDFDYTRPIGTFSNRAATIQIGREISPRPAGKIFHTLTEVNFSYNESTGDLINQGITNGGPPIPFFNTNGYIQDGNFITTGGAGGSGNE